VRIFYLTVPTQVAFSKEIHLIEELAKFEGIELRFLFAHHELFLKYFKGNRPVVLVYNEGDDDPIILKGFWGFVKFIQNEGLIRC
jgi:hypothetical protein